VTAGAVRERLRFSEFEFRRLPSGGCQARVVLEWLPGQQFVGVAEGMASATGSLRCAAEAAVRAIEQSITVPMTFELLGVKALRAFDSTVIIVSLSTHREAESRRIVGSYLTEDGRERGAALAVLNATNRMLGNLFVRTDITR
jgi:hypothetical protein